MKQYHELNIHEKLHLKQYAINVKGKRLHFVKPNAIGEIWNELHICTALSIYNADFHSKWNKRFNP